MSTVEKTIWSAAHLAILAASYQEKGAPYVAEQTGRPVHLVRAKAHKLGLATPGAEHWSKEELAVLHTHYPVEGADYVAEKTGRPRTAVLSKAKRLGISSGRPAGHPRWSEQEDTLLREGWPAGRRMQDLVQELGRNEAAIYARVAFLKVARPELVRAAPAPKPPKAPAPEVKAKATPAPATKGGRFIYSAEEEQLVRSRFPHEDTAVLAQELGRSEDAVRHYAKYLGVEKSPAYLEARATARAAELAEQRLIKRKAKAQQEKKAKKPAATSGKKWWQYPMSSPEYKAGSAAVTAGKKPVHFIDEQGREATRWKNAA